MHSDTSRSRRCMNHFSFTTSHPSLELRYMNGEGKKKTNIGVASASVGGETGSLKKLLAAALSRIIVQIVFLIKKERREEEGGKQKGR